MLEILHFEIRLPIKTKQMNISSKPNFLSKNHHLLISFLALVPTGIIYGTKSLVTEVFDIQVNTIDLSNILRAIMFLYLAVCLVLFLGMWKSKYWIRATQLNVIFMLSLAIGRVLSIILDGAPTQALVVAMVVEFILGLLSIYQLRRIQRN